MQNIERKKVMEHMGMKLTEEHVRGRLLAALFLAAVEAVRQRPELSSEIWLCGSASWN